MIERLYRRYPMLYLASRNLIRNRLRTILAGLGIVIGVATIASLGIFGNTLELAARQYLGDIASMLVVKPAFEAGVRSISPAVVDQIRSAAGDATVVPVKGVRTFVEVEGRRQFLTVYGMEQPGKLYSAQSGTIPVTLESGAILGATVANNMNAGVGDTVVVNEQQYEVVAILEPQQSPRLSPNEAVIVPEDRIGGEHYTRVVVSTESNQEAAATANQIERTVNQEEDRIRVDDAGPVVDRLSRFFTILDIFLLSVGAVSLIVASLSILNIMLMSIVERRQEIGVMRAIGVTRSGVVSLLLLEAGFLGVVGGVIGGLFALAAGIILNQVALGDPMITFQSVNMEYVVLGFAFGVTACILSGIYPAWKAAEQHPVDALRG